MYDGNELYARLIECGYEVEEIESTAQEGMLGYYYAERRDTGDSIYYMYFEDTKAAKAMYDYVKSSYKAEVAELELEIEKVEYALYKSEDVSAAKKGKYYEKYVELTEELEELKNITHGQSFNIVWYGTKQAVDDIKGKSE